jgi:hypothetical protein
LYRRLQYNLQSVLHTVAWLQKHAPDSEFFPCLLGSQMVEDLFSLLRTLEHNRNFDVVQLQDRLRTVRGVADIFRRHPTWKARHRRYVMDRVKPDHYTEDMHVREVQLSQVWRAAINGAEKVLSEHPNIGDTAKGLFDNLFGKDATLLRPNGQSLWRPKKNKDFVVEDWVLEGLAEEQNALDPIDEEEEEPAEEVRQTPTTACLVSDTGAERAHPTGQAPIYESYLTVEASAQEGGTAPYITMQDGTRVHVARLINLKFNDKVEHDSADRLRRCQQVSRCLGGPDKEVPDDVVLQGTPFLVLLTCTAGAQKCCSAVVASFTECRVDGKAVAYASARGVAGAGAGVTVVGQILPFRTLSAEGVTVPTLMWTKMFGALVEVPAKQCWL